MPDSFIGWGQKLDKPAYGAIAVFKWSGGQHAAFVYGTNNSGKILYLGGNQSNSVSTATNSHPVTYIYPNGYTPNYILQKHTESTTSQITT